MTRGPSVLWPAAAMLLFSACAAYLPMPLQSAPKTVQERSLEPQATDLEVPGLSVSTAAAGEGLHSMDAMALAVINDPDLKAARLQAGIARAQLIEAGLFADPQLSLSIGQGPEFTGYGIGINENLQAFVLRGADKAGARANQKKVDLAILWQEWQVALKAGRLFIRARKDKDLETVIERSRKLLAEQYEMDQADFQQSASAIRKVSADLTVLSDADARLRQIQLDADASRHKLNYLLGLAPEAFPKLAENDSREEFQAEGFTQDQYKSALDSLPERRVDLLSLQAGYDSEEQNLRRAVLAQFPALNIGVKEGRSAEEGVHAVNIGLDLNLPLFNGNKGQIALERASREVLKADYQARLDEAKSTADQLWQAVQIMAKQLENLQKQTKALNAIASTAEQHFRSGSMDTGAYVGLETSLLQDEEESIQLHADLDSRRLELGALLGLPFGAVSSFRSSR